MPSLHAVRSLAPATAEEPALAEAPPAPADTALGAPRVLVLPADDPPAAEPSPDVASTAIDATSARRAIASTVIGALGARSRPSQFMGGSGSGSLLASTADAFWGLGEQAAVSLIVEGKAPDLDQIVAGAAQVTAAAANQGMAQLVDDATQFGKDNAVPFLRNLEVGAQWYPGHRPSLDARTIDSLFQSAALDQTLFLQASVHTDFEDTTANLGLGYRYMVPDSRWMLGVNAFYDREFPIGHQRMSIGLEASTDDFTLFGNRYIALSDWTEKNANFDERPLSGWDLGISGAVPGIEDLNLSLAAFRWEREAHPDKTGLRFTADYNVGPAFQIGGTFSADDRGDVQAGFRLTYQLGVDQFGGDDPQGGLVADRRLAFVNRENAILTEKREVPHNYTVSFADSSVTAANQSALAVMLAGAPRAARYRYEIVSSAGGRPVTGEGPAETDPQAIPPVDVSGLPDGTLTLTLRVTSKQGATGPAVTAQIVKSTADLSLSTTPATGDPTNANPIPFTIRFSQSVTEFNLSRLNVSNGTAGNLRSSDRITWTVDVTPAGEGTVTLEVPAGAARSGYITNSSASRASVTYDNQPPAGYTASFLPGPITAASFEIANGEAGSPFTFTISSSGGGTPVTGSGVMTSSTQQITGLDLSGLPDGTLTLSVVLSDTLGNAGTPATGTVDKGSAAPVILAVTPPAFGDYDDL